MPRICVLSGSAAVQHFEYLWLDRHRSAASFSPYLRVLRPNSDRSGSLDLFDSLARPWRAIYTRVKKLLEHVKEHDLFRGVEDGHPVQSCECVVAQWAPKTTAKKDEE
jgi:hypothetical protein